MNNSVRTPLITASLLMALASSTMAQSGPGPAKDSAPVPPATTMRGHMREHLREHMALRHTRHLNELKTKLQLDAQQETAWKAFAETMQAPAGGPPALDPVALSKLSTPERIDQMQALHARHETEMKQRSEATKAFYAGLTAEQKKTFDTETARFMLGREGRRMHAMHHPH